MANILCRTKGNASPKGKPRVYFTCHPEDFERYFEMICQDLFKTHACAVYYTEDLAAAIAAEKLATDLGSNNLFVIPVTYKLLTQPNRAMDADFPYAMKEHIPVLPVMMESGIDMFYSRPDRFGKLQYLNPFSTDTTEISYADKLKKYLDSVLISSETADRIRTAFDAYIFLSYRKKDRHYANELMRLIHRNPECRDIAIWYDEFLTPGESFQDSIEKILSNSKLFTLLVTPNLLEEPEGKPNFVMGEEYPAAVSSGIGILPAEMEATDKAALREKFRNLPECVDPQDEDAFREALLTAVKKAAITTNDTDPEHMFLIGLAYLDGIDVEVDRQRGLELITYAAERELPEAMEKLYNMYRDGIGTELDYRKAAFWAERLMEYFQKRRKDEDLFADVDAQKWMNQCAIACSDAGYYQKSKEILEQLYEERKLYGEENTALLNTLGNLACAYGALGDYRKALEIREKVYRLESEILGEENPGTLISMGNLAVSYDKLGDYQKALELKEKVYRLKCKVLGEEHPDTIVSLDGLGIGYGHVGDYAKAQELETAAYALCCRIQGENHPDTILLLSNLAIAYGQNGNREKEWELLQQVYTLRCKVLGEEHPSTINSLSNLAFVYGAIGNREKKWELLQQVYALQCKVLGEAHPHTVDSLNNLILNCNSSERKEQKALLLERLYRVQRETLGETHPDTQDSLKELIRLCSDRKDWERTREFREDWYRIKCSTLGKEHPNTISALNNLAICVGRLGDHEREAQLHRQVYELRCKVLGSKDPKTITALSNLALTLDDLGEYEEEARLLEQVFQLRREVLGESDNDTFKVMKELAEAWGKLGETRKQEMLLEQMAELQEQQKKTQFLSLEFLDELFAD